MLSSSNKFFSEDSKKGCLIMSNSSIVPESKPVTFSWGSIRRYSGLILAHCKESHIKLSCEIMSDINESIFDHIGSNMPTSIEFAPNSGLTDNLEVLFGYLKSALKEIGLSLELTVDLVDYNYLPGSDRVKGRGIKPVTLRVDFYDDVAIGDVIASYHKWPALSVLWLLILNPEFCRRLNPEDLHGMIIPGLQIPGGKVPFITISDDKVSIKSVEVLTIQSAVVPSFFQVRQH
jgi:hypothetical protein